MSIKKLMASLAVVVAAVTAGLIVNGIARADRQHASPTRPDPNASIVSHRSNDDPQKVREYWTPERMRKARPAPMPTVGP